ncbi:Hypothetical predicted protein [Podarcis lilfordi]|uniref:Uncharacterized protein n=1 Tax=Podarcis lilfordi TaxID=74358 RepID=A0AA35KVE0_9SAUR|nr:Hypothetical predicted protein [Podarcis lilfordi]
MFYMYKNFSKTFIIKNYKKEEVGCGSVVDAQSLYLKKVLNQEGGHHTTLQHNDSQDYSSQNSYPSKKRERNSSVFTIRNRSQGAVVFSFRPFPGQEGVFSLCPRMEGGPSQLSLGKKCVPFEFTKHLKDFFLITTPNSSERWKRQSTRRSSYISKHVILLCDVPFFNSHA